MKGWMGGSRFSLLLTALIAVSMFVYWSQIGDRNVRLPSTGSPASSQARDTTGFTSTRSLDEHYEKHGPEFGAVTKAQYLAMAQALRDVAAGGPVLEAVRKDGVITRYDRDSGAFIAVNPDRTIRTFFKPNDGERYFRRQAERDRG
jgi:pyocin large subunit-like protein